MLLYHCQEGEPIKNITADKVQTGIRVSGQHASNSPDSLDGTPQHNMERGNAFSEALAKKADELTSPLHRLPQGGTNYEKTGLDGMHTHTLRHTAASVLLGANIDEVTVANQLGHRDANTTRQIYAHAIERNKAKSAEALGGVIYGQKVAGEK